MSEEGVCKIGAVMALDRGRGAATVSKKGFTATRMANDYVKVYQALLGAEARPQPDWEPAEAASMVEPVAAAHLKRGARGQREDVVGSQSSKPNAIPIAPDRSAVLHTCHELPVAPAPNAEARRSRLPCSTATGISGASAGGPTSACLTTTRAILSHLELLINGTQPLLLHSEIKADNLSFSVDLTNPDIYRDDKLWLPKDTRAHRAGDLSLTTVRRASGCVLPTTAPTRST